MIITVEFLKNFITTDLNEVELEFRILALESSIRKYTNNNFQNKNIRFMCDIKGGILEQSSSYIKTGDTVEISESTLNAGLYIVDNVEEYSMRLNKDLYDEKMVLVTKIEYPLDVKMGAIEIMRWKLKNENQNYNPEAEKDIQSETISRHSVTYATDTTESDLDVNFGVPKKYLAFLKPYMKARF